MKKLSDIIEAAMRRGTSQATIHDDDIDDWEPDDSVFSPLFEAKPVKPMKPLKPGETKEDSKIASDPNHTEEAPVEDANEIKDAAEQDAKETEKNAPKNNNAVDDLVDLANKKTPNNAPDDLADLENQKTDPALKQAMDQIKK